MVVFGLGVAAWVVIRVLLTGFCTVGPSERAVQTSFGRAQRIEGATSLDDPMAGALRPEEAQRYAYPQVRVIGPGRPFASMIATVVSFRWPWGSSGNNPAPDRCQDDVLTLGTGQSVGPEAIKGAKS